MARNGGAVKAKANGRPKGQALPLGQEQPAKQQSVAAVKDPKTGELTHPTTGGNVSSLEMERAKHWVLALEDAQEAKAEAEEKKKALIEAMRKNGTIRLTTEYQTGTGKIQIELSGKDVLKIKRIQK